MVAVAPLGFALAPDARELTLEEWAELEEDQPGELVAGQLIGEEVPSNLHEIIVSWLIRALGNWGALNGAVVFGSEHKLGISPKRGRKPDVSMYLSGQRLRALESISKRPPDTVVEVRSPNPRDVRRDRLEKLGEYAAFGVRLYVLIDPRARILEILELNGEGRYAIAGSAWTGKMAVPGCAGLVLDLDQLWAEVDRWLVFDELDEAGDEDMPTSSPLGA